MNKWIVIIKWDRCDTSEYIFDTYEEALENYNENINSNGLFRRDANIYLTQVLQERIP